MDKRKFANFLVWDGAGMRNRLPIYSPSGSHVLDWSTLEYVPTDSDWRRPVHDRFAVSTTTFSYDRKVDEVSDGMASKVRRHDPRTVNVREAAVPHGTAWWGPR